MTKRGDKLRLIIWGSATYSRIPSGADSADDVEHSLIWSLIRYWVDRGPFWAKLSSILGNVIGESGQLAPLPIS